MARHYFGTDGIRGLVGHDPITPDFFIRLGFAIGSILVKNNTDKKIKHPSVVIGKDTRVSGYMLESALEAGFIAAGVNVYLTGPMPTPAVAYLTKALRSQAGIVISASHNPFPDNGIKIFSEAGEKLPDAFEAEVELALSQPITTVLPHELGKAKRVDDAEGRYIEFCKSTFPEKLNLRGLKMVLDCAHGATYHVAPKIFSELGAEVIAIGNEPDGFNINHDVGSTHPKTIKEATLKHKADLGIALQLTNIVRDVGEDARKNRIYIPLDELHQFNVSENDILRFQENKNVSNLLVYQIERAENLSAFLKMLQKNYQQIAK